MSRSHFAFAALAASLLVSSAYADSNQPAPPRPTMGIGHGMMQGMFTPEERMMLIADSFKATAGMTDDQKHAFRHQMRDRIMAMSDSDRAKFKADLDTRWAALSPDQQANIKAKVEAFRAARMGGGAGAQ